MRTIKSRPVFSRNLIEARKNIGMSQIELAEKTGLSRRMIAYYELEAVNPPLDKIEIIAKVLGVKVTDLIGNDKPVMKKDDLDIAELDTRTIKKFKQILSLSKQERSTIYGFVDSLTEKKSRKK